MKTLDIIVPVYNEESCIDETIKRLFGLREKFNGELFINYIFVNDGSKDKSFEILDKYAQNDPCVKVINFSRNFGHQMALSAGLDYSTSDYVAIIDADLQDPPELIYDMYKKSLEGFDVVYGKRLKRKSETIFKKFTAWGFYRLLKSMCKIEIPTDTGDFRFITGAVREAFKKMREQHRFIRAMVPWVGFKSTPLYYNRDERFAGETKYPLSKMLKLAFDGIFSFSSKPLELINVLGIFALVLAFCFLCAMFLSGFEEEWIICTLLCFLFSMQLFATGILGQYIGRTYEETKSRPLYIVKETRNL